MPIDYDHLKAWPFKPVTQTYTTRDTILYALGLGLGADPLNEDDLRFTFEEAEGFTAKTRVLDSAKTGGVEIEQMRGVWAELQNRALERVGEVAEKHGVPHAHISLAWLLQNGPVVAPVIGATTSIRDWPGRSTTIPGMDTELT